ncbi:hypothetical protein O7605_14635 [Verrucosispora sp. WMMA2121]|uniref:hypothetical protein n=1 Tax=Verrucosispora sp. WMMA2121 TaxID=3015164 RepID=UPI0022B62B60|nr:hypothetical protein [Verrucosispora sp. WMMA2121]MCZ7420753.1 hypothetical protein [Verrucosispora sp. WMMA2121]
MTKALVSARRSSSSGDCYSWVWVLPLPDGRFRVAAIEVPKQLVDDDVCFFEEDMSTPYLKVVDEIGEVDAAVLEAGVDPEQLDAPWKNDFPL